MSATALLLPLLLSGALQPPAAALTRPGEAAPLWARASAYLPPTTAQRPAAAASGEEPGGGPPSVEAAAPPTGGAGSVMGPEVAQAPADPPQGQPGHGGHHPMEGHQHHGDHQGGGQAAMQHGVGPAGATYDLRWIDAMVQHHTGALRMSAYVFGIGEPALGALGRTIWDAQAAEIRAMGLWRRAWYPQAPDHPVVLRSGGNPDSLADLERMSPEQIEAMRMMGDPPSPGTRVQWYLEGMLRHHGGALEMAHEALARSSNVTLRRQARAIIVGQRGEIIRLRQMLARLGLNKPSYHRFDPLFRL